jgi:hypothetical protein
MGKLDLTEDEATPLVVNDVDDGGKQKWMLAGKILYRNSFHIHTIISALRPAWGNPRGLEFRSVGENLFVAEFESQRDRDRVRDGAPWHISKNAVILEEFVEYMQPSELKFDKLQLWARVLNLPFNLRNPIWGKAIAQQIDKNATQVVFDPVGGYLRARVTVDVTKPLRRGLLIDSAARQSTDWYEIQYEHLPHFCFSCGRLGHSELFCPTPGVRDTEGNWPFGAGLRASDDRKKTGSNDNSSREHYDGQSNKRDTKFSKTAGNAGVEVTPPVKTAAGIKRKGDGTKQVYRKVGLIKQTETISVDPDASKQMVPFAASNTSREDGVVQSAASENESSKKRKTPSISENSAEAVHQPCPAQ